MFAGMVIEDSGADSSWLFGKIPRTQNLMPFRKITVGSLRLLMLRDLDTFIPVTATRFEAGELSNGSAVDLVGSFCLGFSGRVSGVCIEYLELDRSEPSVTSLPMSAVVGPLDPGDDFHSVFLPG